MGAILVRIVVLWAAGWASRATIKMLARTDKIDDTLAMFFGSLVKYMVLAFTVIMVLNQFGVQTTGLIAVMGAAGLAIGLGLQSTLSNAAARVILLLFRPMSVGQFVDAGGVLGTVKSINLFTTEISTLDNVQIWGGTITN